LEGHNPGERHRANSNGTKKGGIKMIPYGFGFEPNDYQAMLDLQIGFKALGRQCKALVKKVGRKMKKK
jgi:hypothetical protein